MIEITGIEGTAGSVTGTTHRAEVTEDNKLAVYSTGSNIHAEHSAHSSGDEGVMPLGVYKTKDYDVDMPDAGDYTKLSINQTGALRTAAQLLFPIVHCNSITGFTVLGDDTNNIATNLKHLHGSSSLSFDKVNGTDNTVFAGVQKTITSLSLTKVQGVLGYIHSMVYLSSLTDCDYFFVRLGTDSSNYNEWRIDIEENWTAGEWNYVQINIGQTNYAGGTGNGWDPSAVTFVAFGVAFNTETDTLPGILVDRIGYASGMISTVDMAATITSDISSPNINVHKIGNKVVDKQAGNVGTGTQRFTIATDDTNLAAINNSTSALGSTVTDDNKLSVYATGSNSTPVTSLLPEHLTHFLYGNTSAGSDFIAPTAGKRLRLYGFYGAYVVDSAYAPSVAGALTFGTSGLNERSKILGVAGELAGQRAVIFTMTPMNRIGDVNEVIRFDMPTFSPGTAEANFVLLYNEE